MFRSLVKSDFKCKCFSKWILIRQVLNHNLFNNFSRFGALWINGMEVLRTTNPEPHPQGQTSWTIEKDLTVY